MDPFMTKNGRVLLHNPKPFLAMNGKGVEIDRVSKQVRQIGQSQEECFVRPGALALRVAQGSPPFKVPEPPGAALIVLDLPGAF